MEKTSLTKYMEEISTHTLLNVEEEQYLAKIIQEKSKKSEGARQKLIESNLKLVCLIAGEYKNYGVAFDDLIAEGNTGLIEAANRFGPGHDARFATYAGYWIRQKIHKALSQQSKDIRLPAYMVDKQLKIRRVTRELTAKLGREPDISEISKATGLSSNVLTEVKSYEINCVSMETPIGDNGSTLGDMLANHRPTPDTECEDQEQIDALRAAVQRLNNKEKDIVFKRFGIGCKRKTLMELGKEYVVSRERIRQIEIKALNKLERWLTESSVVKASINKPEKTANYHLEISTR